MDGWTDMARKFLQHFVLGIVTSSLATSAIATDVTPMQNLDGTSTGSFNDAKAYRTGQTSLGVQGSGAAGMQVRPRRDPDAIELSDARHASVLVGIGLHRRVGLSLGLHATSETLSEEDRANTFLADSSYEGGRAERTSFAGLSLMGKIHLARIGLFRSALGVFMESGAGEKADFALTRSQGPKAGFLNILSFGDQRVAEVVANIGYRYRSVESIGDFDLRNEMIYRAMLRTLVLPKLSLYGAVAGRRIMTRDNGGFDSGFRPIYGSDYSAGAVASIEAWDIGVSGGAPIGGATLGQGRQEIGANLVYHFGRGYKSNASESLPPSVAPALEIESAAHEDKGLNGLEAADLSKDVERITEKQRREGYEMDEFQLAGQRAKKSKRPKDGLSDEEKVTRELEGIHEAERKSQVAEERRRKAAEARQTRESAQQFDEDSASYYELKADVKDDVDALPKINDEEVRWNGLE